jgi:hypothetical protein
VGHRERRARRDRSVHPADRVVLHGSDVYVRLAN